MNIFDSLKKQTFDIITSVMGYNVIWLSESITYNGSAGFKDPSEKQELSGISSWNPNEPFMEYRVGFFETLKSRVDNGNLEHVTIEGKGYFAVVEVQTKHDGDTFMARLRKATP